MPRSVTGVKPTADGAWRARYRDHDGREHAKRFPRQSDAASWLKAEQAKLQTGTWVDPRTARMTVGEWCTAWLEGYATRKPSTVRQAKVHVDKITETFGKRRLDSLKPSDVKSWTVALKGEGYADSYVYAMHARLSQILADAVHDGVLVKSPVSRRTSPRAGSQRPYVATDEQMWALHDAMPERFRAGLLVASLAGLRLAEVCGLKVAHVDFMRGIVNPTVQYPSEPLKTEMSRTAVPIPEDLALMLSAHVAAFPSEWLLSDELGRQMGPWALQRAFRAARDQVPGLPEGFRFHDLRHLYASLLIAAGLDVKTLQVRMRHASAKTSLDTYGHMFPDQDDTTRAAIGRVIGPRVAGRASVAVGMRSV